MNIDLRLTTLDRLNEALTLPITTISVGHEGCPHKLPALADLQQAAHKIRAHGKQFAFVTPISYERFMPDILDRIAGLTEEGAVTVVVNDIGMLVTVVERGWRQRCTLAIGHGLSYSFEQHGWFDLALNQETAAIQETFYRNSLDDPWLCSQLRDWGVTVIEVDNLPRTAASFASLQAAGFALQVRLDSTPVAFARSCHTARYYASGPPHCTHLCDHPFALTTTHRWRLYHNQLEPMSKKAKALTPDFTVYGNVVYRHTGADLPPLSFTEVGVTVDVRHYTPEQLQVRVEQLLQHATPAFS